MLKSEEWQSKNISFWHTFLLSKQIVNLTFTLPERAGIIDVTKDYRNNQTIS